MESSATRQFVIGDVHGCIRTLEALLWKQLQVTPADELFFLGDYIDRGPDSRAVVELLQALQRQGYRLTALRGNHEQLLLEALHSEAMFRVWLLNGAEATLRSFGIRHPRELPEQYLHFFASLPLFALTEKAVLVHAGLNFALPDPFADVEAMLWDRSLRADPERLGGRRLVVGHTPMPLWFIRASLSQPKVFLDGGCVYGHASGYGYLCALELRSWQLYVQPNVESSDA
jgi:serine/threonine protein phosphatase 1